MHRFRHLRLARPLAVLDVETTGRNPGSDRLVEVAAVRFAPHERPVSYHARVNPGRPIPAEATAVHGISDADVASCPPFSQIAGELKEFLHGADLAGFNVKRFDLPFLLAEYRRCGVGLPLEGRAVLDAMQIFFGQEPRDLGSAVRFYCGKGHEEAHAALGDALATAEVLDAQLAKYADLPRAVADLHRHYCPLDLAGKFRLEEGRVAVAFGKHAGRRLAEVAAEDPEYLRWMLRKDFLPDARRLVREALQRFAPAASGSTPTT